MKVTNLLTFTHRQEFRDWLADFDADNQGLFPEDLKRGILAEDTLDDFFSVTLNFEWA